MYLSGIEILFENTGNRMSLKPPNCTLVELKFPTTQYGSAVSLDSKLYLSGIEIDSQIESIDLQNFSKLYLSGIEIRRLLQGW